MNNPEENIIPHAASVLKQGGLVAFPTETVYGLGADASNPAALAKLYETKGRPTNHPVIVHVHDISQLPAWAVDIPPEAYRLAEAFWPGPMTLILRKASHVLPMVTGGQETVGIRIPDHPVALSLLEAFGGGIAAPSANLFGRLSPTRPEDLDPVLLLHVDCVLPGDAGHVGLESTIIDLSGEGQPRVLRPGMLLSTEIEAVLGYEMNIKTLESHTIRTPGSLASHYAPHTPLQLVDSHELAATIQSLQVAKPSLRVAVLVHNSSFSKNPFPDAVLLKTLPDDPPEYARQLYHTLHELDQYGAGILIVETPPSGMAWAAVHDRLRRASKIPPPTATCNHDND